MTDVKSEAEAFLIAEARLLDAGRFDEWLALFAEDGFYWVPAAPGPTAHWPNAPAPDPSRQILPRAAEFAGRARRLSLRDSIKSIGWLGA